MGEASRPPVERRRHAVAAATFALAGVAGLVLACAGPSVHLPTLAFAGLMLHEAWAVLHGRRIERALAWASLFGLIGVAGAGVGCLVSWGTALLVPMAAFLVVSLAFLAVMHLTLRA